MVGGLDLFLLDPEPGPRDLLGRGGGEVPVRHEVRPAEQRVRTDALPLLEERVRRGPDGERVHALRAETPRDRPAQADELVLGEAPVDQVGDDGILGALGQGPQGRDRLAEDDPGPRAGGLREERGPLARPLDGAGRVVDSEDREPPARVVAEVPARAAPDLHEARARRGREPRHDPSREAALRAVEAPGVPPVLRVRQVPALAPGVGGLHDGPGRHRRRRPWTFRPREAVPVSNRHMVNGALSRGATLKSPPLLGPLDPWGNPINGDAARPDGLRPRQHGVLAGRPPVPGGVRPPGDPDGRDRRGGHLRRRDRLRRLPEPPVSSLAEATSIEKSFAIDTGLGCVTAGLIADSRVLVEFLRLEAQRHRNTFGEVAPYSLLGHSLGTHLQQFTQFGGTRPFAVSLLLGGFTEGVPGLIELDPSGATIGWKAYAIGRNRRAVADFLEEKITPSRTEDAAFRLAVQAVAEGSPTPFPPEALDVSILEPTAELRHLTPAEVAKRVSGMPFIGPLERGRASTK